MIEKMLCKKDLVIEYDDKKVYELLSNTYYEIEVWFDEYYYYTIVFDKNHEFTFLSYDDEDCNAYDLFFYGFFYTPE